MYIIFLNCYLHLDCRLWGAIGCCVAVRFLELCYECQFRGNEFPPEIVFNCFACRVLMTSLCRAYHPFYARRRVFEYLEEDAQFQES